MPLPAIFRLPRVLPYAGFRRFIGSPPQPIPIINPPTQGGSTQPPDLVAACIAWLRLSPTIVAAMGETATVEKFFSDYTTRSTAPPYLAFYEPEETEGYESLDTTGLTSALTDGLLAFELVAPQSLGKLGTRQLAEAIVSRLNDAPLTFADGTLVYFRRSERRFPTFREAGSGTNAVVWKRVCEFTFKIERWAPND
jgi:hypothetical protein